ncbi:MAG TPA: hypothetical protein VH253_14110 [Phycisphaerae bacterium]|nr:hypothetical protein [Phycisphaerae bacterium]
MNVKNINPFERHVEKIVLAVAAVGAASLFYLAFQPIVIQTDAGAVPISDVETKVTDAVTDLQNKAASVERAHPNPAIPDFVRDYNRVATQRPLSDQLVAAAVPAFAPLQAPVSGINVLKNLAVVTPVAPAPTDTVAASNNAQLMVGPPAQPGQPNPPSTAKDVSWVQVSGNVPIGDLTRQFQDPKLKPTERVPSDRQRALVVGIQVQRRVQLDKGGWGPWVDVQPSPGSNPITPPDWSALSDAELVQVLNAYDTQSKRVLMPDYYQPATKSASNQTAAPSGAAASGGAAAPGTPGFVPPVDTSIDTGTDESANPPPAPVANGNQPAPAAGSVPFRFYDDSVEPGHLYQYQVRVLYYNPLYRFEGGLKEPAAKNQPFLASDWVAAPGKEAGGAVNVEGDTYFFVSAPFGGLNNDNPKATVRIYKRSDGKWYHGDWTVQPGEPLSGPIEMVDKKPVSTMDVKTPFTVVDIVPDPTGTQQMLILRGDNGDLVERNSASDRDNPQNLKLEKEYVKPPVAPAATKPAVRPPVRSSPQYTPPAPSGGGPGYVPPVDNNL